MQNGVAGLHGVAGLLRNPIVLSPVSSALWPVSDRATGPRPKVSRRGTTSPESRPKPRADPKPFQNLRIAKDPAVECRLSTREGPLAALDQSAKALYQFCAQYGISTIAVRQDLENQKKISRLRARRLRRIALCSA